MKAENSFSNIRQLYRPIQPSVKEAGTHVLYSESLPDEDLLAYIYCYWELKTSKPLIDEFQYRVIADGCIDIFFELNRPTENFVMGFCRKYTQFPLGNSFHYIGIRFLPSMFPQLFKIDAATLSNKFEHLNKVLPDVSIFIENQLHSKLEQEEINKRLDEYFKQKLYGSSIDIDKRFYDALNIILQQSGIVNLKEDLNTGISPRQLRRLFNYYVGDSAKTFSKVVRFQNIFNAKPSKQSLKQNKLFFDVGYYDQSHFIREFKNFYGVTPTTAFRR